MHARWAALAAGAVVLAAAGAQADAKGEALLKKARAAMAKVKTLQADAQLKVGPEQTITATFEGMKPNLGRLVMNDELAGERITLSTGKEVYLVMPSEKQFQKRETTSGQQMLGLLPGSPIEAFYNPEGLGKDGASTFLGTRKVDGKSYEAVQLDRKNPPLKQVLFVNASGFVEGMEATLSGPEGQSRKISFWLKNIRANTPLTAERFAYTPPADFTAPKGPEESLLPVGQAAPDFALAQPGNQGLYSLEQARKDKKAVLVNFWFYS